MRYLFNLAFVFLLAGFVGSCSITTNVHFNKNYSGSYEMTVDLSDAMSMAMMFDSTASASEEDMMSELSGTMGELGIEESLKGAKGISNVRSETTDDGKMTIAMDFKDLEALDAGFKALQSDLSDSPALAEGMAGVNQAPVPVSDEPAFSRKGKVITHRSMDTSGGLSGLMGEGDDGGEMEDMMGMVSSMIDYNLVFTFDRKLKSVEVDGVDIVEQENKLVRARVDFAKMMETGSYEMVFRLK